MADDLYTQWLGVKPGERPPDHYALLCLPTFTHALRAIEAASRAQLDKLDQYAISPDREKREAATQMMNEVAAARLTLADAARRGAYDAQLAVKLGIEVPQDDDMGATVVGGAPVISSALDIGTITEETATPEMAAGDDVPDEIFAGADTLQNMDDYQGSHRRSTIPFGVVVLMGALAILLIAGIIILLVVTMSGDEGDADGAGASGPAVSQLPARPQAPAPVVYDFEDGVLPITCEVRRGEPTVAGGQLALESADGKIVAVELTPKQDLRLFREATIDMRITPGTRVTFGIGSAARLSLTREDGAITYRPHAGRRVYTDAGEPVNIGDVEELTLRLHRFDGSVDWYVNGLKVAVGTDMTTRGIPTLVIESEGPIGARTTVDRVEVKYDP